MLKSKVLKPLIQLLSQLIAVANRENTGIILQHHYFGNIVLFVYIYSRSIKSCGWSGHVMASFSQTVNNKQQVYYGLSLLLPACLPMLANQVGLHELKFYNMFSPLFLQFIQSEATHVIIKVIIKYYW